MSIYGIYTYYEEAEKIAAYLGNENITELLKFFGGYRKNTLRTRYCYSPTDGCTFLKASIHCESLGTIFSNAKISFFVFEGELLELVEIEGNVNNEKIKLRLSDNREVFKYLKDTWLINKASEDRLIELEENKDNNDDFITI